MGQLERALDLVEVLTGRSAASLAEISDELDLPRATVHRLLQTLKERGYVEHLADTHTYTLGPHFFSVAAHSQASAVQRLAGPALADLRAETRETVNLALMKNGRIYYVSSLEGSLLPRMSSVIGADVAAHATALGKAILAALPDEERLSLLGPGPYQAFTQHTIIDPFSLGAEIQRVRERGYAVDDEESDVGAICIATAVCYGTQPVGALSISGVSARMSPQTVSKYAGLLRAWSDRISAHLGLEES